MEKQYSIFRKLFDQLWKEIGLLGKNQPDRVLSDLKITLNDSEQELVSIPEGAKETHEVIIREFYQRCRQN